MNQDIKPGEPTGAAPMRAARLWYYEQSTPLLGSSDRNGNEIVVTTVASYDLDRKVLIVECLTPSGSERTVIDCSQWRGPSGAPGAGAAVRALVDFEDRVLDAVRAWSRMVKAERSEAGAR